MFRTVKGITVLSMKVYLIVSHLNYPCTQVGHLYNVLITIAECFLFLCYTMLNAVHITLEESSKRNSSDKYYCLHVTDEQIEAQGAYDH